jgi:hypothetical protein
VSTTVEVADHFHTMPDHLATAAFADRCDSLNSAFKTVEGMSRPGCYQFETLVVIVAADFTPSHKSLPRNRKTATCVTLFDGPGGLDGPSCETQRIQEPNAPKKAGCGVLRLRSAVWHDAEDLSGWPLVERKRRLKQLIRGQDRILYAEHVERRGVGLFEAICQKDLEGIVAKHKAEPYTAAPVSWFKVLNPDDTQKRGRRELFDRFREQDPSRVASHHG